MLFRYGLFLRKSSLLLSYSCSSSHISCNYSEFKLGKVDIESEKAFLALIDGFVDTPIWIPKSVVDPETKLIRQWFIDQKNKELKDFHRSKKQAGLEDFM